MVANAVPTVTGQAPSPVLPEVGVDTVRALAAVSILAAKVDDIVSEKAPDKHNGENLSKWAIKKKKLPCYRCGEPGHFVAECTTELYDY